MKHTEAYCSLCLTSINELGNNIDIFSYKGLVYKIIFICEDVNEYNFLENLVEMGSLKKVLLQRELGDKFSFIKWL